MRLLAGATALEMNTLLHACHGVQRQCINGSLKRSGRLHVSGKKPVLAFALPVLGILCHRIASGWNWRQIKVQFSDEKIELVINK